MRIFGSLYLDIRRTLYGTPRHNGEGGTWVGRLAALGVFLPVALMPALIGAVICAIVVIADPYHLRPWGSPTRLTDANYPQLETANLLRARSREPHTVILFGGSTSMMVTPQELDTVFGSTDAANFSYGLPTPTDTGPVLQRIIRTPSLKRLILGVDHSQMRMVNATFFAGKRALATLNASWFDTPDFTIPTTLATLRLLSGKNYDLPEWRAEVASGAEATSVMSHPELLAILKDAVVKPSPDMFTTPGPISCNSFPFIADVLLPLGYAAKARGVRIDVMFPPLPYQTYWNWQKNDIFFGTWTPGSRWCQLVRFHACISLAVARLDNVHIYVTDSDTSIAGDLANYKDTVHLIKRSAVVRMLSDVANDRFVLTPTTATNYVGAMGDAVRSAGHWPSGIQR